MGAYLTMWGLLTAGFTIATFRMNHATQFVFMSLTVLFFMLAAGDFTGNHEITKFAGIEGIVCGFSAVYVGMAQVINEVYGKTVLHLNIPCGKE